MSALLSAAQMRQLEQDAIDRGTVSGLDLMERAGRGVVEAVLTEWPDFGQAAHRALVLCGPGNNGGDGFVVARLLQARGWTVDVWLFGDPARLPPDAQRNHDVWTGLGPVKAWDADAILSGPRPDLIVDAVFGIGLTRPLPESVARVLTGSQPGRLDDGSSMRTVAVDCPSGLNLDTGQVPSTDGADAAFQTGSGPGSYLTVTFQCPKIGHYIGRGPDLCQKLHVVDIGLSRAPLDGSGPAQTSVGADVRLVRRPDGAETAPLGWPLGLISKARNGGHKFDHGHAIVFAGGVGRGGAGRLAARAALRAGAGLVTLVCPPAALQENACHLNAVMLRALRDPGGLLTVADSRVTGFCLGPGMGVSQTTHDLVLDVLARRAGRDGDRDPVVVLDADALSSFAQCPEKLFAACHDRVVLTPHEGEFARLFPDLAQSKRAERSKIDIVRVAAARAGCIILLKGADTVIAAPRGGVSVHAAAYDRAAPWLATAGAGDVLAGLILGLAAPPGAGALFDMVEVAAWLHVQCAVSFGPGLIAEDLAEELPRVLRGLTA